METLQLTLAITTAANAISRGLSPEEIALIASIFVQIGDTLATIAAQNSIREKCVRQQEE